MASGAAFRVILKAAPAADGFGWPPDPIEAELALLLQRFYNLLPIFPAKSSFRFPHERHCAAANRAYGAKNVGDESARRDHEERTTFNSTYLAGA
ncbi:MAG TPA: hypothetical protein VGG77_02205 [Roseiarcus sp.]